MRSLVVILALILIPFGSSLFANDSIPQKFLEKYTGRYTLPENGFAESVKIELSNNKLYVSAKDLGSIELTHISEDTFEVSEFSVKVLFIKDETQQKIIAVRVTYADGDIDITGKKEIE